MIYTITKVTISNTTMKLHFDDDSSLTLPLHIDYTSKFGVSVSLTEDEYMALKAKARLHQCNNLALRFLYRMRSEKEVSDHLKKKEFCREEIETTVEVLRENGLLDDRAYAKEFVLSLSRRKVVGRIYVEHKLLQKGISSSVASSICDEYSSLFERDDELFELACKKYEAMNDKKNKFQRLASSLQRLGFSTGQVMSIINRMKESGFNFND